MASLLKVNGVPVPIAEGTLRRSRTVIGEGSRRAFNGQLRANRRAIKSVLALELVLQSALAAEAWEAMLGGDGHALSLDVHGYTSKGYPVSVLGSPSLGSSAPAPAFGAQRLATPSGASVAWQILPSTGGYAIGLRRWNGSSWAHYVVSKSHAGVVTCYLNGVSGAAVPAGLSHGGGVLTLAADGATTTYWDDVWALPVPVPADWPAGLAAATAAFGAQPELACSGDLVDRAAGGVLTMMGEVGEIDYAQAFDPDGSGWADDLQTVPVTLAEV